MRGWEKISDVKTNTEFIYFKIFGTAEIFRGAHRYFEISTDGEMS